MVYVPAGVPGATDTRPVVGSRLTFGLLDGVVTLTLTVLVVALAPLSVSLSNTLPTLPLPAVPSMPV